MNGQEYIIKVLQDAIDEETLGWIKHLSRTSTLPIKEFPAVIAESQPFDYSQAASNAPQSSQSEAYEVGVFIEAKNLNDISEDEYKVFQDDLKNKSDEVIGELAVKAKTFNKIASVSFEKGEIDFVVINATPVLMNQISVKVVTAK